MIHFSPAKINIGLQILERREDGFHNLRSVMFPTALCDIIEIYQLPGADTKLHFTQSGIRFEADTENNLCIKAWKMLSTEITLPPVAIHLHKQIPVGAGLGGGSSNASTILKGLNQVAGTPLSTGKLEILAARLGSDCPFFLHNVPMMMEGRGELLSPVKLSLENYCLVLLFPKIHIPTAEAYRGVTPAIPAAHLEQLTGVPVEQWKDLVVNDFEERIFATHPKLAELKNALYGAGACYAAMSGSGSSLYGVFSSAPILPDNIQKHVIWKGPAQSISISK